MKIKNILEKHLKIVYKAYIIYQIDDLDKSQYFDSNKFKDLNSYKRYKLNSLNNELEYIDSFTNDQLVLNISELDENNEFYDFFTSL